MPTDWISDDQPMQLSAPALSFAQLVWSDHLVVEPTESKRRTALLFVPRLLLNPSLQLAFLVRVAQKGPRALWHPVRLLQTVLFSSEAYWFRGEGAIEIGPGVSFPHPWGILIGPGTRIGSEVAIYNAATIGTDRDSAVGGDHGRSPWIGDGAVAYAHTTILGPWRVGQHAVIGTTVFVDQHVPPGALLTRRRLRLRGEWQGRSRYLRFAPGPEA